MKDTSTLKVSFRCVHFGLSSRFCSIFVRLSLCLCLLLALSRFSSFCLAFFLGISLQFGNSKFVWYVARWWLTIHTTGKELHSTFWKHSYSWHFNYFECNLVSFVFEYILFFFLLFLFLYLLCSFKASFRLCVIFAKFYSSFCLVDGFFFVLHSSFDFFSSSLRIWRHYRMRITIHNVIEQKSNWIWNETNVNLFCGWKFKHLVCICICWLINIGQNTLNHDVWWLVMQ